MSFQEEFPYGRHVSDLVDLLVSTAPSQAPGRPAMHSKLPSRQSLSPPPNLTFLIPPKLALWSHQTKQLGFCEGELVSSLHAFAHAAPWVLLVTAPRVRLVPL